MYSGYKHITSVLVLALVVILGACDNSGTEDPISDDASALFFGDWNLAGASDDNGNQIANLAQNYAAITASFDSDSSFVINLDATSEEVLDVRREGTYSATESTELLRLATEVDSQPVSLTFSFDIGAADSSMFAITSTTSQTVIVNSTFGTSFTGPTTLTFTQVEQ